MFRIGMHSFCGLLFTILFLTQIEAQVFIPFSFYHCVLPINSNGDTLNTDFLAGTTSNTTVSGTSVVLSAGQTTGTFTSRVFSIPGNCLVNSNWLSFSWIGSLPYGKLLPDYNGVTKNESIADYSGLSSSVFMTGVMASWHMQETSAGTASGGKDFSDYSGNNNHGTISGGVTLNAVGKIGRAVTFDGSSGYINFGVPSVITGLGNWSTSFWIYPVTLTVNQQIILYRSDNDLQQGFFVTLSSSGQIKLQTVFATKDAQTITSNTLTAGVWSNVVITTDSTVTSTNSKIYINGAQATYTGAVNGSGVKASAAAQPMYIGKTGTTSSPTANAFLNARLQEVTFFNRILNATEVIELYRRGINRVKLQFRSCILANCADLPPWKGPDGTNGTFFTELNNNSAQSTWLGNVLETSPAMIFSNFSSSAISNYQYFQYKATLETDNTTYLPDLKATLIKRP